MQYWEKFFFERRFQRLIHLNRFPALREEKTFLRLGSRKDWQWEDAFSERVLQLRWQHFYWSLIGISLFPRKPLSVPYSSLIFSIIGYFSTERYQEEKMVGKREEKNGTSFPLTCILNCFKTCKLDNYHE